MIKFGIEFSMAWCFGVAQQRNVTNEKPSEIIAIFFNDLNNKGPEDVPLFFCLRRRWNLHITLLVIQAEFRHYHVFYERSKLRC